MTERNYIKQMNIFTDATRLKIIYILSYNNFCSIHLEKFLDVSQPNISRHIDKMINAEIVTSEKKGRRNIYQLNQKFVEENSQIISQIRQLYHGLLDDEQFETYKKECEALM